MAVVILFHGAILQAKLPHEFHAAHLKPDGKVRVIDHAHVVGLGIAYAEPGLADDIYFVVHFGFRFSRKLVTPSLKSAVWRMAAFSSIARASCRSSWSLTKLESRALVARNEAGLFAINCLATSRARAMSRSWATIPVI